MVQALDEVFHPELFAIINRHKSNVVTSDEEVELDINVMSPELLLELRAFIDRCKR